MTSELLQKYLSGDATEHEKMQVVGWVNEHPDHLREYMALRKMRDIVAWQSPDAMTKKLVKKGVSMRIVLREFLKVAAVIAVVLSGVYFFSGKEQDTDVAVQTLYVPTGQRAELVLSDGTKVWLNSHTRFVFPNRFGRDTRNVRLDGEGYFEVAKDSVHPFIVETAKYNVRVLGTEFDVKAYDSDSIWEAYLLKGAVELYASGSSQNHLKLTPNTMACLQGGRLLRKMIAKKDDFLWREGILSFKDTPVDEMMNRLQLYYEIKIEVNNKSLLQKHYTGKFRIKDGIEHVLRVLQLNCRFTYIKDDDKNKIIIN